MFLWVKGAGEGEDRASGVDEGEGLNIVIGKARDDGPVAFDLDTLLATRLLIQANSGAGKSYLLRKLIEMLHGHVQIIVIDPEGEFATLREKYPFVLVGKGGETPVDTRSAALVAEKLLELRASAVCDLYEMKPVERHKWVRLFLDAMVNAPKKLWHPCIVIVDEAHSFCPEKSAGESEASEAMIDLSTRGRKRGYCAVWATQRLSKLRKDASAELLNRLVGGTFEDLDIKRALDLLSVAPEEKHDVSAELKTLEPGWFYAFGRAIAKERTLFKVGKVETTHPQLGSAKHAAEPPPPPNKIRDLLPKLADLPQAAEEKARTIEDFRREIRSLKAQLSAKPKPEIDEVAVQRTVESAIRQRDTEHTRQLEGYQQIIEKMQGALALIGKQAAQFVSIELPKERHAPTTIDLPRRRPSPAPAITKKCVIEKPTRNGDLTGPEQRILNAIAWMNSIGVDDPEQTAVAFLAGYTIGGGAWNNPRGSLNTKGLVQYVPGDRIRLTDEGRQYAEAPTTPLDEQELQRMVLERLPGPEQKILRVLIDAYPQALTNEELAEAAGYSPGGGAYNNPRGRLRTLGLIEYQSGKLVAKPLLFLQ